MPNPTVVGLVGRPISGVAPTDTQVYAFDLATGLWTPTDPGGGGGGLGWLADVDDPLTSLAALTTFSGTWSINGGQLQVVVATSVQCRAFSDVVMNHAAMNVVEVEIEIPSSGFTTANSHIRVGISPANANGTINMALRGDDKAYIEEDGLVAIATAPFTLPAAGTFVKVRLVYVGQRFIGYVDGVRMLEALYHGTDISGEDWKAYVVAFSTTAMTVRFRNLKAWSAKLVLPA